MTSHFPVDATMCVRLYVADFSISLPGFSWAALFFIYSICIIAYSKREVEPAVLSYHPVDP